MKTRNGFVSNSSTSSFLIFFKDEACKCCGVKPNLIDVLKRGFTWGDSTELRATEIDKYKKSHECYYETTPFDETNEGKFLNKYASKIDKGYTFVACDVEYKDKEAWALITAMVNNGKAIAMCEGREMKKEKGAKA